MPPSALPDGDPAPPSGELPAAALAGARLDRARHLRPRAVLHGALRLLRLQHLHADRARRPAAQHARPTPTRASASSSSLGGPRATGAGRCRRCSSAAAPRRCCRRPISSACCAAYGTRFGLAPGRGGHDRGQPGLGRPRRRCERSPPPASRASASACSRPCRTCCHAGTHPRPGQRRRAPWRRRATPACRSASTSSTARRGSRSPTGAAASRLAIALEPDHVSAYALVVEPGTKLARPGPPRASAAPDDDDQADKYELADELLAAAGYGWYEVSNWARVAGRPLPTQHRLLGRHQLVGRRPGRAQPRRWSALVERQAPERVCRSARGRLVACPGA